MNTVDLHKDKALGIFVIEGISMNNGNGSAHTIYVACECMHPVLPHIVKLWQLDGTE